MRTLKKVEKDDKILNAINKTKIIVNADMREQRLEMDEEENNQSISEEEIKVDL